MWKLWGEFVGNLQFMFGIATIGAVLLLGLFFLINLFLLIFEKRRDF